MVAVVVGMEGTVVVVVGVQVVAMEGLVWGSEVMLVVEEAEAVGEMVVEAVVDVEVNISYHSLPYHEN